jgi:hypothetical protein
MGSDDFGFASETTGQPSQKWDLHKFISMPYSQPHNCCNALLHHHGTNCAFWKPQWVIYLAPAHQITGSRLPEQADTLFARSEVNYGFQNAQFLLGCSDAYYVYVLIPKWSQTLFWNGESLRGNFEIYLPISILESPYMEFIWENIHAWGFCCQSPNGHKLYFGMS